MTVVEQGVTGEGIAPSARRECRLEPLDFPEDNECHGRQQYREEDNQREGMRYLLDVNVDVHAIEAGDERGHHEHNREAGHAFHDGVHVVRDDGGEGVHRAGEDVAVNIHHVVGLPQLNHHVVEQLRVLVVLFVENLGQFADHHFVASNRGVEVYEALLQVHQSQQVFVADAPLQLLLGRAHLVVNLLQVLEVPHGRRVDEPQDKLVFVGHRNLLAAGMLDEVGNHVGRAVADRNENLVVGDDADGHGGV